jgi:hypothetical protein
MARGGQWETVFFDDEDRKHLLVSRNCECTILARRVSLKRNLRAKRKPKSQSVLIDQDMEHPNTTTPPTTKPRLGKATRIQGTLASTKL